MPEWPGEKFAPEQIALNEIALDGYKLRWHSDIIYQCNYLDDGLTKGSKVLEKITNGLCDDVLSYAEIS